MVLWDSGCVISLGIVGCRRSRPFTASSPDMRYRPLKGSDACNDDEVDVSKMELSIFGTSVVGPGQDEERRNGKRSSVRAPSVVARALLAQKRDQVAEEGVRGSTSACLASTVSWVVEGNAQKLCKDGIMGWQAQVDEKRRGPLCVVTWGG